jgi:hypothetical protein
MSMQQKLKSLIPQRHKNAIRSGIAFGRRLLVQPRMMPAFTIIDAQKSGTSSLFDYLIRHGSYLKPPSVCRRLGESWHRGRDP